MTNITVSRVYDDATFVGSRLIESNVTCVDHVYTTAGRVAILHQLILFVSVALGVPGNLLSAIIWLRRHVVDNNSSAIYLATLAVNDLAFQLCNRLAYLLSECSSGDSLTRRSTCMLVRYIIGVAILFEPLLVLGFSVERLVAILRPLQVCYVRRLAASSPRWLYRQITTLSNSVTIQV